MSFCRMEDNVNYNATAGPYTHLQHIAEYETLSAFACLPVSGDLYHLVAFLTSIGLGV